MDLLQVANAINFSIFEFFTSISVKNEPIVAVQRTFDISLTAIVSVGQAIFLSAASLSRVTLFPQAEKITLI